jgi:membrane protease YdiL (CAAX protease family)
MPIDALPPVPPLPRWVAVFEVIAVSGVPTQLLLTGVLLLTFGISFAQDDAFPTLRFVLLLSLLDTAAVVLLIGYFLRSSQEHPRDVFLGARPFGSEATRGLLLVPLAFLAVAAVVLTLRELLPWTHTVTENPLEAYLASPGSAAAFLVVVVLAGGVREELQRAFILHRFEQRLGGARVGLAVFSVAFGAMHVNQGVDVAVAIGLLGLAWGVVYVRRRSAVLPMFNHGGFNALQVVQGVLLKSVAG